MAPTTPARCSRSTPPTASFVWQSSTSGSSLGRGGPVYSTPAVAFGRVYLGSIDGRVYSFEQSSGELAWSHSTGDWVYPAPAVADTKRSEPTVYIGSKDQEFYALDAKTGDVRWQKDIGGIVLGAASVVGEVAYVGVIGPNIGTFGFDVKTGKQVFEHEFGEYNPVDLRRPPALPDRRLGHPRLRAQAEEAEARQAEARGSREARRRWEAGGGGSRSPRVRRWLQAQARGFGRRWKPGSGGGREKPQGDGKPKPRHGGQR